MNPNNQQQWTVYIGPNKNELIQYFKEIPSITNDRCCLRASYFGSSSRIGEEGTVFNSNQDVGPLDITDARDHYIMIRDHNNTIRFELLVTAEQFTSFDQMSLSHNVNLPNGVTINLRDLHRYPNYPYEISGISWII